ncbi:hypothetical protein AHiyo8_40530 [Arthrobacter sp. Hiyo8]|nr:hypothetical protein AHiyo8_40530 [Arthrobacter sp. Hiyo8]
MGGGPGTCGVTRRRGGCGNSRKGSNGRCNLTAVPGLPLLKQGARLGLGGRLRLSARRRYEDWTFPAHRSIGFGYCATPVSSPMATLAHIYPNRPQPSLTYTPNQPQRSLRYIPLRPQRSLTSRRVPPRYRQQDRRRKPAPEQHPEARARYAPRLMLGSRLQRPKSAGSLPDRAVGSAATLSWPHLASMASPAGEKPIEAPAAPVAEAVSPTPRSRSARC